MPSFPVSSDGISATTASDSSFAHADSCCVPVCTLKEMGLTEAKQDDAQNEEEVAHVEQNAEDHGHQRARRLKCAEEVQDLEPLAYTHHRQDGLRVVLVVEQRNVIEYV
jgi:hypothetical protein